MEDFSIGADAEFSLFDDRGNYVDASHYLSFYESIGRDGHPATAEIRPGDSLSPLELVAKIRILFNKAIPIIGQFKWQAGHYANDPIGGHIHFGIRIQDSYIASLDRVFKTLARNVENSDDRQRRNGAGYGAWGDCRTKTDNRFEYRSPPSWLVSPEVSLVYLTMAKVAVLQHREIIDNGAKKRWLLKQAKKWIGVVPDNCIPGLKILPTILNSKIDWHADFKHNWNLDMEK